VTFDLLACHFRLTAQRLIRFPAGSPGNVLRGALGDALRELSSPEEYARIFHPSSPGAGPSGLSDWPRLFVLRAPGLSGRSVQPGESFCFGLHLFDTASGHAALDPVTRAFAHWAAVGSVEQAKVSVDLNPRDVPVSLLRIDFQTPTDLKQSPAPRFDVLLARIRDRVSTLRGLYGAGPLAIDFRGLVERARSVETVRCELKRTGVQRRSTRTGQRHAIGGFTGFAEYQGDLAEFLPYLEAARWTGVGRHCSWGNGQIATSILSSVV
jgi:hypothetical protein